MVVTIDTKMMIVMRTNSVETHANSMGYYMLLHCIQVCSTAMYQERNLRYRRLKTPHNDCTEVHRDCISSISVRELGISVCVCVIIIKVCDLFMPNV